MTAGHYDYPCWGCDGDRNDGMGSHDHCSGEANCDREYPPVGPPHPCPCDCRNPLTRDETMRLRKMLEALS